MHKKIYFFMIVLFTYGYVQREGREEKRREGKGREGRCVCVSGGKDNFLIVHHVILN